MKSQGMWSVELCICLNANDAGILSKISNCAGDTRLCRAVFVEEEVERTLRGSNRNLHLSKRQQDMLWMREILCIFLCVMGGKVLKCSKEEGSFGVIVLVHWASWFLMGVVMCC